MVDNQSHYLYARVPITEPGLIHMLNIRKQQLRVLDRDKRKRFVAKMLQHVQVFFPNQCALLGENQLREWVEHGINCAASYRIASERDVCKYIDVMIVFGKNFDQDSRLPWASKILKVQHTMPTEKTRLLFEAAKRNQHGPESARG
jgi:hypothetical protein